MWYSYYSMSERVTIKLSPEKAEEVKNHYSAYQVPNDGEYVSFAANYQGIVITVFTSKKTYRTVTFVGQGALSEAKLFDENAEISKAKVSTESKEWVNLESQIGSDEVGVGDLCLPMIVVAAFVRKSDMKTLKMYGVNDSKKLSDQEIMDIGDALGKRFFISKLTLTNEKYNEMIDKGENLNSLKAKMHNRALLNLFKRFPDTKYIFVDQFCAEDKYFAYLTDKRESQVTNITFKTKGESYYPSVALASVLARYSFLKEKEKLEKKYKMSIPFGAGTKADEFVQEFLQKYGEDELEKLVKKNFNNYKKLKK